MKYILLIILVLIITSTAFAGGTSIPVEMLDIKQSSSNKYILVIQTLDTIDYEYQMLPKNTVLTIYGIGVLGRTKQTIWNVVAMMIIMLDLWPYNAVFDWQIGLLKKGKTPRATASRLSTAY